MMNNNLNQYLIQATPQSIQPQQGQYTIMVPPGVNLVPISTPNTTNISPSQLQGIQNQLTLQQLQQLQQQQQGTIIQQPQQSGSLLPIQQQIQGIQGLQGIQTLNVPTNIGGNHQLQNIQNLQNYQNFNNNPAAIQNLQNIQYTQLQQPQTTNNQRQIQAQQPLNLNVSSNTIPIKLLHSQNNDHSFNAIQGIQNIIPSTITSLNNKINSISSLNQDPTIKFPFVSSTNNSNSSDHASINSLSSASPNPSTHSMIGSIPPLQPQQPQILKLTPTAHSTQLQLQGDKNNAFTSGQPSPSNSTQSVDDMPGFVTIKQDESAMVTPPSSNNTNDGQSQSGSTRIISFNGNNGQIMITPVQTKQEPMFITNTMNMASMNPSHLTINNLKAFNSRNPMLMGLHMVNNGNSSGSDEDDKRSIHSASSMASVSTYGSRSTKNTKLEYACEHCGKSFKHKSNLKIHFIIHTDEALSCEHCGKKFARKSNLTQHLRVHTGERPYICQFCSKSFKQSHSLKDHVRIHTGEKPYDCEFCGKSFKVKHNMVVHRRLHTGEKPFDCPLCLKKFASKSSLNGHTKKTHPNQWWSLHPDCKGGNKKYDALLSKQGSVGANSVDSNNTNNTNNTNNNNHIAFNTHLK